MPSHAFARPVRPWAAALVLALHVLGLLGWLASVAGDHGSRVLQTRQALTVVLLQPPKARRDEPAPRKPVAKVAPQVHALPFVAAPARDDRPAPQPQAIHEPPLAAPMATAASAAPLNLALPRAASATWRQRHPGLDDTRANTPRPTLESRLNAVMGDGREVVEDFGEGRKRVRQGSSCTIIQRSRAAELDPTNESFSPKPALMGNC